MKLELLFESKDIATFVVFSEIEISYFRVRVED